MPTTISEPDWKTFRQLREIALQRFCERILAEVSAVIADTRKTHHERYRDLWDLLRQRDEELAGAFDNPRRSAARLQLALIGALNLLTEDELGRFSDEARDAVRSLADLRRG